MVHMLQPVRLPRAASVERLYGPGRRGADILLRVGEAPPAAVSACPDVQDESWRSVALDEGEAGIIDSSLQERQINANKNTGSEKTVGTTVGDLGLLPGPSCFSTERG